MHKRLVAGLSRLVTCLQSNFIGTNFAGFCSNLGVCGLFSSPFVSYWVHIDWLAPGYLMGAGNPTISRETETQDPAACQPQPRQPHMIHTIEGFGVVNKAEIDVFLKLSCFFDDPVNVGILISGSSAFSKTSLNIWKVSVHVLLKPGLENFEHYFTSVRDECNCAVV